MLYKISHYALYTRYLQDALGAPGLVFCIFRLIVTECQSIYRMASFNELFEGFIDTSLTYGPNHFTEEAN